MLDFIRNGEFAAGSPALHPSAYAIDTIRVEGGPRRWSVKFRAFKFLFDAMCTLASVPLIAVISLVLLVLNPIFNRGPLFFSQIRMGQYGEPFRLWKFRTMTAASHSERAAEDKLEEDRITKLGRILRKSRIDELPNFFNVLAGQMSVVGPRPDAYTHASEFERSLPGYKERHRVKPGITGLAQVEMGYAEGSEQTALKAKYDNIYAARSCGRLDLYVIRQTFLILFTGAGR